MFKYSILILSSILLFNACSLNNYNIHNSKINFSKNLQHTSSLCTDFSHKSIINSSKYGKIYKESITLNSSCFWNGFTREYFTDLFKNELKLKSFKKIETLDFANYEITTFKINDEAFINFIYFFLGKDEEIIIDYSGKLSEEIAQNFNKNYKSKYINKTRFTSDFNTSLVEKNIVNHYFNKELESNLK